MPDFSRTIPQKFYCEDFKSTRAESPEFGEQRRLVVLRSRYGANILQVHDVKEMRDVCRVADTLFRQSQVVTE